MSSKLPVHDPPIRIVLIEDHADFRESVTMVLEQRAGYKCVGGFSTMEDALEAIRGGWTDLVIDQQQWLQGYLPVLQICLTVKYGFSGLNVDTGPGFAHADNIEALAALVEEQIR